MMMQKIFPHHLKSVDVAQIAVGGDVAVAVVDKSEINLCLKNGYFGSCRCCLGW